MGGAASSPRCSGRHVSEFTPMLIVHYSNYMYSYNLLEILAFTPEGRFSPVQPKIAFVILAAQVRDGLPQVVKPIHSNYTKDVKVAEKRILGVDGGQNGRRAHAHAWPGQCSFQTLGVPLSIQHGARNSPQLAAPAAVPAAKRPGTSSSYSQYQSCKASRYEVTGSLLRVIRYSGQFPSCSTTVRAWG